MANPEHVEIVQQGAEAIRKWREKNLDVTLDLSGADLRGAKLSKADLGMPKLREADLREADLREVNLGGADLDRANLDSADLRRTILSGAALRGANLSRADLGGANLYWADLREAMLYRTNLYWADLGGANLNRADLREANLKRANLREASLRGANLQGVRGADHASDLETVRFTAGIRRADHASDLEIKRFTAIEDTEGPALEHDASYFDTCRRPWPERWFDWERLRVVGRLPLFGASYTVLILIPILFYVLAVYNRNIDLVHAWAQEATLSPNHPLHRLAPLIRDRLHHAPIPHLSLVLLISTVLLAVGSTLYTFFCPSRIKEFSRDQWCDQLDHSLLHYWPFAWKRRYIRLTCAACYALGGFGAACVLGWKLWKTGVFIWMNTTWPW